MKKKRCELCSAQARMHCQSDQANLCWDCDEKVHAANFLVAKHSRTVLCHACQSPTPWKASGPKLGRTVSICHACVCWSNSNGKLLKNREASTSAADESEAGAVEHVSTSTSAADESEAGQSVAADDDDDSEDRHDEINNDDYDGEEDHGESVYSDDSEEEDGENQVVPRTSTPPPTNAGSSGDDDEMDETQFDLNEITRTAITAKAEDKSASSIGDNEEDSRILRPSKYRRLLSNERPQLRQDSLTKIVAESTNE